MDIEGAAVSAVKAAISMTDYLEDHIQDKDREPTWDGHIYVYSRAGNVHSKGSFAGKVPVQIKGKLMKNQSKDKITYQVEVDDLKNFRRVGGTMFFVVYLDNNNHKKIYYSSLLPYVINSLLKDLDVKKKKVSVTFHAFPSEKNEITNLLMNFARDMGKQDLLKNGEYSLEQAAKDFDISKFSYGFAYTGLGYSHVDPIEYLLKHDMYFYASNEERNIHIVVDHMDCVDFVVERIEHSIGTGGKNYYSSYEVQHSHSGKEILVGKSFRVKICKHSINVKYSLEGNLEERIQDIHFLIKMFENMEIVINGVKVPLNPTKTEMKSFHLNEAKRQLKYLQSIKEVLDSLGVKKSLSLENFTEKDEINLKMLLIAFKYGKTIRFNNEIENSVCPINIGNLRIVLCFKQAEDLEYEVLDYFKTNMEVASQDENGRMVPTSQYCILREDDYLTIDNINLDKIVLDFKRFENPVHFKNANLCVLEMLKAYDRRSDCISLSAAEQLAKWLMEKDPADEDLYRINLYQCYRRYRELAMSEKQELYHMTERWKDNAQMMAGICLLLKEIEEADRYLSQLNPMELEEFKKFPIYRFHDII